MVEDLGSLDEDQLQLRFTNPGEHNICRVQTQGDLNNYKKQTIFPGKGLGLGFSLCCRARGAVGP